MRIEQTISDIRRILSNDRGGWVHYSAEDKLRAIEYSLPREDDYKFISSKKLLLQWAEESGKRQFKLLATMNSHISIFEWCDDEYNFMCMCRDKVAEEYRTIYTLEELHDAIDNAEKWLKSIKEDPSMSGSPYFISSLQIMSL